MSAPNFSIDWRDKHTAQYRVQISPELLSLRVTGQPEEAERVARLIAAAPQLLTALEIMERAFNVKDIDPLIAFAAIEKARHAIAQATEVQS